MFNQYLAKCIYNYYLFGQGVNKILFYYPAHEDENKKVLNIGHIEAVICFTRYA